MRIRGFHHLALQAFDVERVTAFYRDLLGLPELKRHHRQDGGLRSIWLALPDGGFLAVEDCSLDPGPGPTEFRTSQPGYLLLALRIAPEDRAAVREELARHGVEVVHETRWTMYVHDPEGNRVGLSHHPHDPLPPLA
jgi:glyoxylase I family protein